MEEEKPQDLKLRTKNFSIRIIKLFQIFPHSTEAQLIGKQLFRCGTSVGANTRSAFRGRSTKEFLAKIGIVIEEADECRYWLEILAESGIINEERLVPFLKEADELTSIFVSIYKKHKN